MPSLFQCIRNLFRNFDSWFRTTHQPVDTPQIVELKDNPVVEEVKEIEECENNLEEPESEPDIEDIYSDLPELIPMACNEYATDEELDDLESNDSEYNY